MNLRIYLAGSWRHAPAIRIYLSSLRKHGLDVDCFCDQENGRIGFDIADYLKSLGYSLDEVDAISALNHPAVSERFKVAFNEDKKWLDWANCVLMMMPCGRSSHLEAGYMKGKGGLFYIFWMSEELPKGEFDNIYQFADGMFRNNEWFKLITNLKEVQK